MRATRRSPRRRCGGGGLWRCAVVLAMAVLPGFACSRPDPQVVPAETPGGGTVVVAILADVTGVNPLIARSTEINRDLERRILFEPLLEERADLANGPPTFEPALAESWSFSEDGLELTFRLREGLVWNDGQPITAEDVRWTWQAQIDPDVAWAYADKKGRIESVEVVDDRTVLFRFTDTYPDQLADANEGAVLPRHVWGERPFAEWRSDARWFVDRLATSGPFELVEWRPNAQVELRRNERYYRPDLPRLERVVLRVVPDKTGQINQLLGGAVDYVQQVPRDELERLERAHQIELDAYWSRQYDYLCWNVSNPLFADVEMRRALTMAIDRQEIVDTIYRGYARLSTSPILSTTWAYNREVEPWPYDPRVARLILARKGFDTGSDGYLERDGERLGFELLTNVGNRTLIDAGTIIQEQLRRVGIEVRLRSQEFNTYVERLKEHDFEASLGAWNIDTSLDIRYAFHSESIDDGYNFGRYSNPEVDRLIEEQKATPDLAERRRILHRLQEILHQEQPYTFLFEPRRINARRSRVRGTRPTVLSSYDNLEEWWVEE